MPRRPRCARRGPSWPKSVQQLDYTVVRAPFAGIVTRRFVHVGEAVQAGPPSPQPLIPMESLARAAGRTCRCRRARWMRSAASTPPHVLPAGRTWPAHAGDDVKCFPMPTPQSHTFVVRLPLARRHQGLYPGMSVKVAFCHRPGAASAGAAAGAGAAGRDRGRLCRRRTRRDRCASCAWEPATATRSRCWPGWTTASASPPIRSAALAYLDKQHAAGGAGHE